VAPRQDLVEAVWRIVDEEGQVRDSASGELRRARERCQLAVAQAREAVARAAKAWGSHGGRCGGAGVRRALLHCSQHSVRICPPGLPAQSVRPLMRFCSPPTFLTALSCLQLPYASASFWDLAVTRSHSCKAFAMSQRAPPPLSKSRAQT